MARHYAIKKGNKYVREFSEGKRTTTQFSQIELYTDRKSAQEAARGYGRMNGRGYSVVDWC